MSASGPRACPLPRWPRVSQALGARGWRVHHLARALDQPAAKVFAWLYGQEEAPPESRRRIEDVLELDAFNEDDLYQNLDWLAQQQEKIEDRLFRHRYPQAKPELYLYDVASSYLEGVCNALAAFGYNRDGRSGKRQIVYGLLCDPVGLPVSIEAFPGNTTDTKTFGSQIRKVTDRFGGKGVTLVGDRGMIKGPQIEELQATIRIFLGDRYDQSQVRFDHVTFCTTRFRFTIRHLTIDLFQVTDRDTHTLLKC